MYIFFDGRIYARILGLSNLMLTLSAPVPDEEKKLTETVIFTLLCGASKGLMKAFKGIFTLISEMRGAARVKPARVSPQFGYIRF